VDELPQRSSLVSQTADFLAKEIARGKWAESLPGERTLAEMLQISRSTLRRALVQLRGSGAISTRHGVGNRVCAKEKTGRSRAVHSARQAPADVALLSAEPLERLSPTITLWVDELRAMLSERGRRLHVINGRRYARRDPSAALEALVRQQPHACWVLLMANRGCQHWFARRDLPCIVAGSCHAEIDLPYRDIDHRATCRHAAGTLLGLGHRQLAFLAPTPRFAGDIESEAGFCHAVKASGHADARANILTHDGMPGGILRLLKRLAALKSPPTALLVTNPYHTLATLTGLGHLGWRVPKQVSLISRDDDSFLSFVVPEPARYLAQPTAFARSLLLPVCEILAGHAVSQRAALLMPEFLRGTTVAHAPKPQ